MRPGPSLEPNRCGRRLSSSIGRLVHDSGTTFRTIDWSACPAVERDSGLVSGARVFLGARVPIAALFENLEDDALVSQFVEWFPVATTEQARAALPRAAA